MRKDSIEPGKGMRRQTINGDSSAASGPYNGVFIQMSVDSQPVRRHMSEQLLVSD
jgi:hypothetical protein